MTSPIDRYVTAIEGASIPASRAFAADAILDATVPNWRFGVRGGREIEETLSGWYAQPGHLEQLTRTPLPGGELLELVLSWEEDGVPHTCHQAHVLQVTGDAISRATVWCGGRWPASLMAEMEAAASANV